MARSASGQTRIDYGTASSVITNPASGKTILLDHVKQEVRVIPTPPTIAPPQFAPPGMPGMPAAPVPPATPATSVKDLGTKVIQGVEARGTQYTLPPLAAPTPPAAPQMPAKPAIPGAPAPPGLPGAPKPPALPQPMVAESWVSTKLQMPVLTRITGSFGQSMCHCKNTVAGEPPPSAFQIPPGYKQVGLPPAPAPPAMPGAPAMPSMPAAPSAPAMPSMPGAPAPPSAPAAPAMPAAPKPPTFKF